MFLRTSFEGYQERAEIYISEVVSRVKDLQWYTAAGSSGGPIIMTQVGQIPHLKGCHSHHFIG